MVAVEGFEVEVELPEVFGREAGGFEFDGDQAVEAAMEEEQIEGEILFADLQRIFTADKTEIAPEFEQELPQLGQQAALQLTFAVNRRQGKKSRRGSCP